MFNDNFKNYRYIEGRNGEYIRTDSNIKLFPVTASTKIEVDINNIAEGHYKIAT